MNPIIVLIHGALSDASIWRSVHSRLQQQGLQVLAPAMPMRSLADDIDYLAAFLSTVDGPVVLVGHSYAGTVISAPAFATKQVLGLIYAAAFAPDDGESTVELNSRWPGSGLNSETTLVRPYRSGRDLYLKPESFQPVYAQDVADAITKVMASSQRPIDPAALGESFRGKPAWKTRPTWMLITTEDRSLPPAAQHFMASRMGATVREVACSHAAPVAQPESTFEFIMTALHALSRE